MCSDNKFRWAAVRVVRHSVTKLALMFSNHIALCIIFLNISRGLGGLVVTRSAAGAKGPELNSTVVRAYSRFNSRVTTLAGKQCWLCAVRLQQTVIV